MLWCFRGHQWRDTLPKFCGASGRDRVRNGSKAKSVSPWCFPFLLQAEARPGILLSPKGWWAASRGKAKVMVPNNPHWSMCWLALQPQFCRGDPGRQKVVEASTHSASPNLSWGVARQCSQSHPLHVEQQWPGHSSPCCLPSSHHPRIGLVSKPLSSTLPPHSLLAASKAGTKLPTSCQPLRSPPCLSCPGLHSCSSSAALRHVPFLWNGSNVVMT